MNTLFRIKGFLPFLSIMFFNAFVDLGHKILIQNTLFKVYDGQTQIIFTAIVNGLILLPFILLFTPSGYLSDRFQKPHIIRYGAAAAVVLTLLITLFYYLGWFWLGFGMTFLLAVQSAIYSPAKFGFIKPLVGTKRLAMANAWVQAVTISAILFATFLFSIGFEWILAGHKTDNASDILKLIAPIGWLLVFSSLIEWHLASKLPLKQQEQIHTPFTWNSYLTGHYLKENLSKITVHKIIFLSMLGLSIFWGVAQAVLATFPAFAKFHLQISNTAIIQGLMAFSGIGIFIGSLIAGKASNKHIETGMIPIGWLGVTTSLFLLPQVNSTLFVASLFLALGIFGGFLLVTFNSLIQFHAQADELGRMTAGKNWVQNIVMSLFLGLTIFAASYGLNGEELFWLWTLFAFGGLLFTFHQFAKPLARLLLKLIVATRYRITTLGIEHIPEKGSVLMLGNHISWIDWAILAIASPRQVRFVMHRHLYSQWYMKWFLDLFGVIPIAGGHSKEALNQINQVLKKGEVVCLFPEGSISRNGQLAEFKAGFERTVKEVEGVIIPFYLHGLWGNRFSRSDHKLKADHKTSSRHKITVAFGEAQPINSRAETIKQQVFDLSIDAWNHTAQSYEPIPLAWLRRVKRQGRKLSLVDVASSAEWSGHKTLTAVLALSTQIRKLSSEQNVGLLLPTSAAGIASNMAALLVGKTVVNLNYTANINALISAIDKAEIRNIYSSRRFMQKLQERGVDLSELQNHATIHYLEDWKNQISSLTKLKVLLASLLLPARLIYTLFGNKVSAQQTAAILFSSGSEGAPKGVELSHINLRANIAQVAHVLDNQMDDRVLSSLPLFHAFGLTATSLMPLIQGLPAICHPDPTDSLTIAKAITKYNATIYCGTSTFLRLFARNHRIDPLLLAPLRLVVAGAEKLRPEVRESFQTKFLKPIIEGYGATETGPVASVNMPNRIDPKSGDIQVSSKIGTVGLPLPGGRFLIVDPETLEPLPTLEDGLILFSGPQVLTGYLKDPEKTQSVLIEIDGKRWYKTGDKGHLDSDGYLTIVDRYSRFAKIGGEMVSLGAIEEAISAHLPEEIEVAATTIPDTNKGERIVLLIAGERDETIIKGYLEQAKLHPLSKPSKLIPVAALPKLGSGKSDFSLAKKIALEACS